MRTTIEIDDSVLRAARALALQEGVSLGHAVSELALRGLRGNGLSDPTGFPLLPPVPGHVVTDELVAENRDE